MTLAGSTVAAAPLAATRMRSEILSLNFGVVVVSSSALTMHVAGIPAFVPGRKQGVNPQARSRTVSPAYGTRKLTSV